jgi:hypothetical protein
MRGDVIYAQIATSLHNYRTVTAVHELFETDLRTFNVFCEVTKAWFVNALAENKA